MRFTTASLIYHFLAIDTCDGDAREIFYTAEHIFNDS
jgi:hypothetical protein